MLKGKNNHCCLPFLFPLAPKPVLTAWHVYPSMPWALVHTTTCRPVDIWKDILVCFFYIVNVRREDCIKYIE